MAGTIDIKPATKLRLALDVPAGKQPVFNMISTFNKALDESALVLKTHRAYTIYLPQSYDKEADRKYPILYLLHGMSGVNTSWFTDQRVKDVMDQLTASGEACEMIIEIRSIIC